LPECLEQEPNNDPSHAQKVTLPIVVNGRIDRPDDWDVYEFTGRAGDTVVAEVSARRLESSLDSVVKITDAAGKLVGLNDDHEDPESGANTHDADSYLTVTLPADGKYYVHIGDTARHGGEDYAYRLRISAPQPDFVLQIMPSSFAIRGKASGSVPVYAIRKEGFTGPIKLSLKDPPAGFSAPPSVLPANQSLGRLMVKSDMSETKEPVSLVVEGRATVDGREIVRKAVPGEDRMQAFLWRHLLPADELKALVSDPSYQPALKRTPPAAAATVEAKVAAEAKALMKNAADASQVRRQLIGRVRQLRLLYEDWLLTDDFYARKLTDFQAAVEKFK
jgi:hypothetical protein